MRGGAAWTAASASMAKSFRRLLLCLACCVIGQAQAAEKAQDGALALQTVPTRPDLVSGGDIRVVISGTRFSGLQVLLNGRDITDVFARSPKGASGLVRGLRDGKNELTATEPGKTPARLAIINHPIGGPIISGPQLQPWICATPQAQPESADHPATSASGVSQPAIDAQCNVKPEYTFYYRTSFPNCAESIGGNRPCFKPYDSKTPRPVDMSRTTTSDGRLVDYIIRAERGAINRGLYDIVVLYDPAVGEHALGWNHKIVWSFGGGTGAMRRQTPPPDGWVNDDALSQGYMSVVSNFTAGSRNSNRVLAAETVMMVKEYISDTYGEVVRTIGEGCSAGSMQQITMATMYPGLLDGLLISCSFPDTETTLVEASDALLVKRYFDSDAFKSANHDLSPADLLAKQTAITGHKDMGTLQSWAFVQPALLAGVYAPAPMSNNCALPNAMVYDKRTNPNGVRCGAADHSIAVWGTYPKTNIGRTYLDNVGVQYGLKALLAGKISGEDFLQLNRKIGGYDRDGEFTASRSVGDPDALRIAYQTGLISDPKILSATPIIDLRGEENSGVHSAWNSFALRARFQKLGDTGSYVLWRAGMAGAPPWTSAAWRATGMPLRSLAVMDQWIQAIANDAAPGTPQDKVKRDRPQEAFSFCYLGTDYEHKITDEARCDRDPQLAYYSSIRQQAGGPLASDILKCRLRPPGRDDYQGRLTDAEYALLKDIFKEGVCDWSVPGVGQQGATPWLTFASGSGGKPLPVAPGPAILQELSGEESRRPH